MLTKRGLYANQFKASTSTPPPPFFSMLLRGTFEPCLGGVGSWKQRKTLVLILNMEEFEGEESDFVSKCLSRKFTLHRMMLISKKNSAATKTKR